MAGNIQHDPLPNQGNECRLGALVFYLQLPVGANALECFDRERVKVGLWLLSGRARGLVNAVPHLCVT